MSSGTLSFDPRTFYTFNNTLLASYTLSTGSVRNYAPQMTAAGSFSSENWQIFAQGGRFFIRNYDYGANYQLGLSQQDQSTPKLYPRSGSLAQQWSILVTDGGYQLVNGLLGNGTWLELPGKSAVPPTMRTGESGRTWTIMRNPSADATGPKGTDMYSEVQGFEISQASSSSTPSISSTLVPSSVLSTAPVATPTSPSPSSPPTLDTPASTSASTSLPIGAIVGIVLGSIVFLIAAIFAIWFFAHKRKATRSDAVELSGRSVPSPMEKYAHSAAYPVELPARYEPAELDSDSVALVSEKGVSRRRAELP